MRDQPPKPEGSTGIAAKIPRARVQPAADAAALAAAAVHTAAAVRGAHAGRDAAQRDPALGTVPDLPANYEAPAAEFVPVREEHAPAAELPHRTPVAGRKTRPAPSSAPMRPPTPALGSPAALPRAAARPPGAAALAPPPRRAVPHAPIPIDPLPAEFMPSAAARAARAQAVAESRHPSLGSVPLGPITLEDLDGPGAGRGRNRRTLIAVVAGLVVLALALGAVALIWLWRERGPAVESALPDLGEKPELGSAVDIGGALGGGLDEVWFQWVSDGTAQGRSAFLDADTIIACGRAEGGVVIGAVDVYESTANWKVNLAELTGDAAARPGAVWADGNGGVALALAMGDDSQAVATVTAKGEGSWRPGVQLLGAGAGLVAMREGGEVLVASTADLEQDQWRADAPAETASTAVLTSHDGIFWVWTGEGYREAKGGAAVGFGASGEAVSYRLEEGSVLLAVNPGEASSSVKRIDPKTGQGLWKDSLSVGGALTIRQPGDWLIVAGESEVKGIDPGSGAVKWSLPAERLIDVSGDTAFLLSADNKISAVEASSGALDYQLAVRMEAADNASFAFGSKTAYVLDGSVLRAYRLAKDGETLWSLDLPDPGEATYYIHHADRKIWLQAGSSLRPLSGG